MVVLANVVEVAIRGIDEASKIFEDVGNTASKSLEGAEESINTVKQSLDDVSELEINTTGAEASMSNASNSIYDVQDAIEETEDVGSSFGDKMGEVFETVAGKWKEITAVAGTAGAGMEGFARSQGDVNSALDRTSIATGISSDELRDMAVDMSDATTSTSQQAEAFELLSQRGVDTEEQMREIIPSISDLGTATGQDLAPALESADKLLKPFGQDMDDVGDNVDQMARIIQQTDIPLGTLERNLGRVPNELSSLEFGLDDASAGIEIFRDRGFDGREAVRAFRKSVEESEGDMSQFLESIGMTSDEWEEYQKSVEPQAGLAEELAEANEGNMTIMQKMQEHVSNLMVEYGAFADLGSMLAPILISLGPIIKGVSSATALFNTTLLANPITWIIASIAGLIAIIALLWTNWEGISDFLGASWDWLIEKASAVFGSIGEFFSDAWNLISDVTIEIWGAISDFLSSLWEGVIEIAEPIFGALITFFETMWNIIETVTLAVWNVISVFLTEIWQGFIEFAEPIFTALVEFFTFIWETVSEFTIDLWMNLVETLIELWESIIEFLEPIFLFITEIIVGAWEVIKEFTIDVWEAIIDVLMPIWESLKEIVTTVFGSIKDIFVTIWETIKDVTTAVWDAIWGVLESVWDMIKTLALGNFESISEVISIVWDTIKDVTSAVWDGIVNSLSAIWDGISNTVSTVFNTIKDTIAGVWEGVKDVTSTIWDGIVSVVKAPINLIIGLINGMIDALNSISIKLPKVPDWVPGLGGKGGGTLGFDIPNVPKLAKGGLVQDATMALVGEGADEEAVLPLNNSVYGKLAEGIVGSIGGSSPRNDENAIISLLREIIKLLKSDGGSRELSFEGANFIIREEADIKKVARELYNMQRKRDRGGGN